MSSLLVFLILTSSVRHLVAGQLRCPEVVHAGFEDHLDLSSLFVHLDDDSSDDDNASDGGELKLLICMSPWNW